MFKKREASSMNNQSNSSKYFFNDFTLSEYTELLRLAKKTWRFTTYNNIPGNERFILWRHDVDFSMHAARNLARIEHAEGVIATYFLLPHSEFYNLFEKEITDLVKYILSLGHEIGLHFDSHYYDITDEHMLENYLLQEKRWLQEVFNREVKVFSFHNTTEFTMNCKQWQLAGMINTYARYFQENINYCSDSNGIWRFNRLKDILESGQGHALQVLTHPEWWQEEVQSPRSRVKRCIEGRSQKQFEFYNQLLVKYNRPNIDWE